MGTADRGKVAEEATQKYLTWLAAQEPKFEFSRLIDTKAAGRTIKAAAADFEYFCGVHHTVHGLIEVKETEHDFRLSRDRITQLARLRKREKCGGTCYVLVYHSKIERWRCLPLAYLVEDMDKHGTKGSWDLTNVPSFMTADGALSMEDYETFLPYVK